MLQRQQASAIIDARKMIVDGAVGMVEMALDQLNEKGVVELDEERKLQWYPICSLFSAATTTPSRSLIQEVFINFYG